MSVGLDKYINDAVSLLESNLWTTYDNYYAGRSFVIDGQPKKYVNGKEYKEVFATDKYDSIIHFHVESNRPYSSTNRYKANVYVMVAVNLGKIYGNDERAVEKAHLAVNNVIKNTSFEITELVTDLQAYDVYTLNNKQQKQFNMQPFYVFRLETEIYYTLNTNCNYVEPTQEVELTIQAQTGGTTIPAPGTYTYDRNSIVPLYAVAETGYRFVQWLIDNVSDLSALTYKKVTKSITAIAQFIAQYVITTSVSGNGTINNIAGTYDSGTQLTLTATPDEGNEFVKFTDSVEGDVLTNPYQVIANASKRIDAYFQLINRTYYVRPSGGSYGREDGSDYDNAFNGFANIAWHIMETSDLLYVCGMHTELLNIGKSGTSEQQFTIKFNAPEEAGSINGLDTIDVCINSNDQSYITIEADITNKTFYDAVVSCVNNADTGTGIIYNNIWADGSGNQAYQNLGSVSVTYNACKGVNNTDNGLSCHDSSVVIANYCDFSNNASGAGCVGTSNLTINNSTINNNSVYGLGALVNSTVTANLCEITGGAKNVYQINTSKLTVNNSLISNPNIRAIDCSTTAGATLSLNKNKINGLAYIIGVNTITVKHNWFEDTFADPLLEIRNSVIATVFANVFKHLSTGDFTVLGRTTSNMTFYNNTVIGGSGASGIGTVDSATITSKNNIYLNLATAVYKVAGTITSDNDCFYGNTTDATGLTPTNKVTGNPNLHADGYPVAPSSVIGTGLDLGASYTDILDKTSVFPYGVVLFSQSGTFNIGAYKE